MKLEGYDCIVMVYGCVPRFPPVIDETSLRGDPFKESNKVPIVEFHAGVGYEKLTDDVVPFTKVRGSAMLKNSKNQNQIG